MVNRNAQTKFKLKFKSIYIFHLNQKQGLMNTKANSKVLMNQSEKLYKQHNVLKKNNKKTK